MITKVKGSVLALSGKPISKLLSCMKSNCVACHPTHMNDPSLNPNQVLSRLILDLFTPGGKKG